MEDDFMEPNDEISPRQTSWKWKYVPWVSAIIYWLSGVAATLVGLLAPVDSHAFRGGFLFLGIAGVICGFFLPKTVLSISADKKVITKSSGPWLGFWMKVESIPLENIQRVILRWRVMKTNKGSVSGKTMRLLAQNADGQERDLFPGEFMPSLPEKCGRSLAEFLQVEFRVDGDRRLEKDNWVA
jgi:hypothetical protein